MLGREIPGHAGTVPVPTVSAIPEVVVCAPTPAGEPTRRPAGSLSPTRVVLSTGALQVLAMAFTLGRSKMVAVVLGPTGIGTIGLIDQAVGVIAQVCAFSLPSAAVKFFAFAHSESREAFTRLYSAMFQALLVLSLLGTFAAIATLRLWPGALGPDVAAYGGLLVFGLLGIPGLNISVLVANAMAAARRPGASAVYGFLVTATSAVLAVAGVAFFGLRGYYAGSVIGVSVLVAGGMVFLSTREGLRISRVRSYQTAWFRNVAGFSAALYLVSFTSPLADLVARLAVLRVEGLATVGLFQAAVGMALALKTVIRSSFAIYFMPAVNRKTDVGDKFAETAGFVRALSIIMATVALPLVLFPGTWLSLLYSHAFVQVSSYVWVFVLATMLQVFGAAAQTLLTGLDHIGTFALASLAGDLTTGALSWWLVPHVGLYGVGIAMASGGSLALVIGAWRLWSTHRLRLHAAVGRYVLVALAAVGVAAVAAVAFHADGATAVAGKLLVGLALWGLVLTAARR